MDSLNHQLPARIPVIDFTGEKLKAAAAGGGGDSISWLKTSQEVVSALEEYGCFNAIYDGVSVELHETIFGVSEELFDLPVETKVLNTSTTPSHGYVGQVPLIPLYEGLGIENATTIPGVDQFTNLMWPSGNRRFSETVLTFSKKVAELDQMVMKMVSERYGIETHYKKFQGSISYLLKLIKYQPPPPQPPAAADKESSETKNMGIIPHTDKSFMSILHQHQVKGLEIKAKDGQWILIDPSPSSFIVMAGDACMAWTNGRIEPPQHRVIMSGEKERYSLGLFTFVRDLKIEVPEELVDEEHPLQFKPFDHYKLVHFIYSDEGKKSKSPVRAFCGVCN